MTRLELLEKTKEGLDRLGGRFWRENCVFVENCAHCSIKEICTKHFELSNKIEKEIIKERERQNVLQHKETSETA